VLSIPRITEITPTTKVDDFLEEIMLVENKAQDQSGDNHPNSTNQPESKQVY
jgi:hypothetical protein